MNAQPSKIKIIYDFCDALADALKLFIREMCVKFIALWIELLDYRQDKQINMKRIVSLLAIVYIISFLDFDLIPIIGNLDDVVVMHYAYHYSCNKDQDNRARAIYKDFKTLSQIIAYIWLLI